MLEVEGSMMEQTDFVPTKLNYRHENIIFLYHCARYVIGDWTIKPTGCMMLRNNMY